MDSSVRAIVAARAAFHCEFCQMHEADDAFSFHVEHVIAVKHGGSNELDNLAYACQHCNLHKGPNLSGIDPVTGAITPLYHPRRQKWSEHFAIESLQIVGVSACGRATVNVLAMNDPDRVRLRALVTGLDG